MLNFLVNTAAVSESVAAKLPTLDSLKRSLQHQRVRHLAVPIQPATLEHLNLTEEYKKTSKGEPFPPL